MIAYRIWTVDKRSPKSAAVSIAEDHVPLRFIVRIVIESALIYTSASIFAFFVTVFKTNVSFISEFVSRCITYHLLADILELEHTTSRDRVQPHPNPSSLVSRRCERAIRIRTALELFYHNR